MKKRKLVMYSMYLMYSSKVIILNILSENISSLPYYKYHPSSKLIF